MSGNSGLRHYGLACASAVALAATTGGTASAQVAAQQSSTGEIIVTGEKGYAAQPDYAVKNADLGPLGDKPIADVPASVTVVPEDLIVNDQARTVNDTLRYLPSVEVRDQQGFEVSRPQSRGFQGSIVQDTRLDGLNIVGTTAIPAENLAGIQVLNGLTGALYGPQSPAGVFDYELKRPTQNTLFRVIGSFDSMGIGTGQIDASATWGPIGYRFNIVHGQGEGYVDGSHFNRTLLSGDFDIHIDDRTVIELDLSHYQTEGYGLPGSIVYFGKPNILLPKPIDPTRVGYGQRNAGVDLVTSTGLAKLMRDLGSGWRFEIGGLYQNADRGLYGITNTLTDKVGDYSVTKNFTAVPRFTVASNTASLTGTVSLFGLANDIAIGTNGFVNGQYSYRNSKFAFLLGTGNLANPAELPTKPQPATGGEYKSGRLFVQSIVLGDIVHFDDRLALHGTLSSSFLNSKSMSSAGAVTSSDTENGVFSGTVSLTYKPIAPLTLYATYSNSVEQGETAPTNAANSNQILSPYRDREFEAGAKYQVTPGFLVTAAGFRMTRPLADTSAANVFAVVGTQRNWGGELFGQGAVTPALSLLGGVTYIDARLIGSVVPFTNDKLVVGVPHFKSDVSADLHPAIARGFALTGTVHYESDRAATNTNTSFAPSYATADIGVRYNAAWFAHHETLRVNVINVGDKRYFSSIADGNIVGSPGANTAYSGAPRTVLASLEFDL